MAEVLMQHSALFFHMHARIAAAGESSCGRWLTLRALRVHLLWTCTLAAAIFTLIPVVPTWLFGLPAAVELFARVRRIAALPPGV